MLLKRVRHKGVHGGMAQGAMQWYGGADCGAQGPARGRGSDGREAPGDVGGSYGAGGRKRWMSEDTGEDM